MPSRPGESPGVMWPMALLLQRLLSQRHHSLLISNVGSSPGPGSAGIILTPSGLDLPALMLCTFSLAAHPLWLWTCRHQWFLSDLDTRLPTPWFLREAHSPAAFHALLPRPQLASLPTFMSQESLALSFYLQRNIVSDNVFHPHCTPGLQG